MKKIQIILPIAVVVLVLCLPAMAAKKKLPSKEMLADHYFPVEVVESIREDDILGAIRGLRMEANSPRRQFVLRELQRIDQFETKASKETKKNHRNLFNIGVAYHNLYLFLLAHGTTSETVYKDALKYYKKALKTKLPERKNNVMLMTAALYASHGDIKKADKTFSEIDFNAFEDKYQKAEGLALYYSARGDVANALSNLKEAHTLKPEQTTFWLAVSDDFVGISEDKEYRALLKKWGVKRLAQGTPYTWKNKKLVY